MPMNIRNSVKVISENWSVVQNNMEVLFNAEVTPQNEINMTIAFLKRLPTYILLVQFASGISQNAGPMTFARKTGSQGCVRKKLNFSQIVGPEHRRVVR